MTDDKTSGLKALERDVARDLARLNYPPQNWVPRRAGPDGQPLLDVLIVGGGMCGQTAAFALMREGVRNLRVVDRAATGGEGPWATFARMETLRSPKHLTGPDLGVPSLTFRAWFEAQHDDAAWATLHKVPRLDWWNYLLWVRRMTGVSVENRTELLGLLPRGDVIEAQVSGPSSATVLARKVVLALGREGSGATQWPAFPSFVAGKSNAFFRVLHANDAKIDFTAWKGKHVGVLGAGASAFDNAASALEAGAAKVTLFMRRPHLPQVNKSKWTAFAGCLRGLQSLDDEMRWRFYTYILDEQVPPPYESVLRCDRFTGFSIRFGEPWLDIVARENGVAVTTSKAEHRFDAVIVATGFDVDLAERSELAAIRNDIALWTDRVTSQEAQAHPEAARFPYLGDGFQLSARVPDGPLATSLADIHVFNWGATMSHGALAGDIPGLAVGATRLANAIVRDLFRADAEQHYAALRALEESELKPTRYYVPPALR